MTSADDGPPPTEADDHLLRSLNELMDRARELDERIREHRARTAGTSASAAESSDDESLPQA
ncbi:hypothetical protein V5P93_005667 [Actinokineospora auranticolor]|uniref:Uncharacterized protein n=1 Tax=Actinokineospora auranticolor TaxID=155976 RepID=A0A2S6GEY2_9PSEU|nr:hypothetical protein [Actinokineospora auranticolor]PPK63795.1 hypothetical protein CLV40_12439 [Actinokineospora auranticolor]